MYIARPFFVGNAFLLPIQHSMRARQPSMHGTGGTPAGAEASHRFNDEKKLYDAVSRRFLPKALQDSASAAMLPPTPSSAANLTFMQDAI